MPLDNSLNRNILHILRFHCVLSRFLLDGEGIEEEERNIRFSFSTPKEIARGLKRIWESKMGTPSSVRIIQDVDLALKALGIVYLENGAAVEGLADKMDTDEKWWVKGKVSVGEVHGQKVRGASENSAKICSCTVIC